MMRMHHGFSLIELMVVISLFALLMGLGVIQLSFLDSTIARAEIEKLITTCVYMQQLAISTNQEKLLSFNLQGNEYRFENHHEALSSNISYGLLPGVKGPPGDPRRIVQKPITFPSNTIHFYPTGTISSGTVYLVDKNKRYQYALSNAVSQVSFLRVYFYDGKWKSYGYELKSSNG